MPVRTTESSKQFLINWRFCGVYIDQPGRTNDNLQEKTKNLHKKSTFSQKNVISVLSELTTYGLNNLNKPTQRVFISLDPALFPFDAF